MINWYPDKKKITRFFFTNKIVFFFSCREKKDSEVHTLESSKDLEVDTIDSLEKENDELRDKLSKLKSHYVKLFEFAKKNSIELKPRNVPMGSLDSTWSWVEPLEKNIMFVQKETQSHQRHSFFKGC